MRFENIAISALMLASMCTTAFADDWIADRLRGTVTQWEHGEWVALSRGDVVPDGRKIRTGGDGRVDLVRGAEIISLASNTEIAVRDAAGQKMTSVIQTLGSVTIEAERRNVQHFSVQTPVLAAVVKGTQFTVTYRNGQARVEVERGLVQVQDTIHNMIVDLSPGQYAAASQAAPVDVSGPGAEKVVYLIEGEVVPAVARSAVINGDLAPRDALESIRQGAVPNSNAKDDREPSRSENNVPGNGPPAHSNAGGNRRDAPNGGSGGPPGHSNAGGHGGPPEHSHAGGNGNGEPPSHHADTPGNSQNNGSGPPAHSNAGGHGGGPPAHSNAGGGGPNAGHGGTAGGPPTHSNAGGNGNGKGKK